MILKKSRKNLKSNKEKLKLKGDFDTHTKKTTHYET